VGANEILAPYWGFFSTGHFAGHERKFGQDFKDIFSELYREFESRLVRQLARASVNGRRTVVHPLQTARSASDAGVPIGRHRVRHPPHGLLIWGCRFHFRFSFNDGSTTDVAALRICASGLMQRGKRRS
jgi:hypothetical protein